MPRKSRKDKCHAHKHIRFPRAWRNCCRCGARGAALAPRAVPGVARRGAGQATQTTECLRLCAVLAKPRQRDTAQSTARPRHLHRCVALPPQPAPRTAPHARARQWRAWHVMRARTGPAPRNGANAIAWQTRQAAQNTSTREDTRPGAQRTRPVPNGPRFQPSTFV